MEKQPNLTEREMAEKLKKAYKMQMEKGIEPAFSDDVTEELNRIKDKIDFCLKDLIRTQHSKSIIKFDFETIRSEIDKFEKLVYENRKPIKYEIAEAKNKLENKNEK